MAQRRQLTKAPSYIVSTDATCASREGPAYYGKVKVRHLVALQTTAAECCCMSRRQAFHMAASRPAADGCVQLADCSLIFSVNADALARACRAAKFGLESAQQR